MRVRRVLIVVAIAVWGVVPVPASGEDTSGQGTSATLCDQVSVSQFSDVGAGRYAADYILCMRALGLSVGTASGAYNPESDLTRAQMATFLVRLWRDVLGMGCPEGVERHLSIQMVIPMRAASVACTVWVSPRVRLR